MTPRYFAPKRKRAQSALVPTRSEHREQCDVFAWAERSRGRYSAHCGEVHPFDVLFAIPNAGGFSGGFTSNVVRAQKLKREGVKPGAPDFMLAYPIGGLPGLFVEMKRKRGSATSPEQKAMLDRLARVGYVTCVARGFDEARLVIEAYLQPLTVPRGGANAPA